MTITRRTAALILAAGRSSRIGALKPLLALGESTLVEQAFQGFIQAGIRDIHVVVGHRHEEITPVLDRQGISWVLNPDHESGMLSSILAGVRNLPPHVDAFFLLPADNPLIKPRTIEALLNARQERGSWVTYPRFLGKRGHPPLIARTCIPETLSPDYEGGLRAFLKHYEDHASDVDVVDQGILLDCNTGDDYTALCRVYSNSGIPTEKECLAIWELRGTPEPTIDHSRVVAEVARLLAVHLNLKGLQLNTDLIMAAGHLHDIAKGEPDHAQAGAAFLRQLGYGRVADTVACHMDIVMNDEGIDESALLFLADKCVKDDRIVSPQDRFNRALENWSDNLDAVRTIQRRRWNALTIRNRIEAILGQSVENVLQRHGTGIRAASAQGRKALYLVRHGSVEMEGEEKRYLGQGDPPLSREGIRQAEALRDSLRHVRFSAIYCSDLRRSLDTAAIIGEPHGLKPRVIPGLREIHLGDWEGLTFESVRARFPDLHAERGRDIVHCRPPGGESFLDCARRVIPALVEILHSGRGNILVAGHAGVNRIILCQALGWSLDRVLEIRQDHGCLNVLRVENATLNIEIINGEHL
ncbi:MAG: NTP transferase domain-containing protein [Syntrophobacteraceae bacterium]|nr:NTP transferase domain-containing protein [Syntrophobacteraceae bacterium]